MTVPDKFTGDVMGDLNKRRGRVLGMNPDHSGNQIVEADVPMSELYGYNTDLRSMTGGIGSYSYEFQPLRAGTGGRTGQGDRGSRGGERLSDRNPVITVT